MSSPRGLRSFLRGTVLQSSAVRQRVLAPIAFDAAILLTNLVTGVVVARALGPHGRGQVAAILLLGQTAAWIFSMGAAEAISYRVAKVPQEASRLLTSWFVATVPLVLLAIGVTELALPTLFGAQTQDSLNLARIFVSYIALVMVQGVVQGMLLGDEDFLYYNLSRFVGPTLIAIGYLGCVALGRFSASAALTCNMVGAAVGLVITGLRSLRRHGLGRFDLRLLRETLWFGVRAHAGSLAGIVNARLDLLIIPAFLSAASIGLYSVATNTTSIISTLTGTVAIFALPVAVRRETQSTRTIIKTLHAVVGIGIVLAIPLAIFATPALTLIYGSSFDDAATSLRILLPGSILNAGAIVLWSGLIAANRPFLSSIATLPAAVFTVVGLLIFLQHGGIEVAAIVTTVAYSATFVVSIFLYRRVAALGWREYLSAPPATKTVASAPTPDV